ncbi:hypothetical protein V3481_006961 [Fusarium oxysporum f. sp. vasinfectum]
MIQNDVAFCDSSCQIFCSSARSNEKNIYTSENDIFENNSYLQRHSTGPKGELDSPVSVALPSAILASWRPRGEAETKAAAENLARHINSLKNDLNNTSTKAQQTMEVVQRSSEIAMDAKTAATEATEISKATMKMIRDMKLVSQQTQANAAPTYANASFEID